MMLLTQVGIDRLTWPFRILREETDLPMNCAGQHSSVNCCSRARSLLAEGRPCGHVHVASFAYLASRESHFAVLRAATIACPRLKPPSPAGTSEWVNTSKE